MQLRSPLIRCMLLVAMGCSIAACDTSPVEPTRPSHKLLTVPTDAQGNPLPAQTQKPRAVPFVTAQLASFRRGGDLQAWRTRIDVGGEPTRRPFATEPIAAFRRLRPDYRVRINPTRFGTDWMGICLGDDELAITDKQSFLDIQHCRGNDQLTLWLPIARGTWVAIGDRAIVRPDVVDYVHELFAAAPAAARSLGLTPASASLLRRNRAKFDAFVAAAHARGVRQVEG